MAQIEIRNLTKEYPDSVPLKGLCADIDEGSVVSIIGPSGTGKSTLLRCIIGLETPTSGDIIIEGENICTPGTDIGHARRKMGMVFQSFNLFEHLTAVENIMLPQQKVLHRSAKEAYEISMKLLNQVGLEDKARKFPSELSGGQKQRTAIARALGMDPRIILFDEPTSALDPAMVGEVQVVIRDLAKTGRTMLIVTHEMTFAKAICDRVFYMDEGIIYEDGTPQQIFDAPQREKTRHFIHKLKVLEISIENEKYDFPNTISRITQYCEKNQISARKTLHIQLAFEELVHNQLVSVLKDPKIRMMIEYSAAEDKASVTICYNGEEYNAAEEGDPLALAVLRSAVSKLSYSINTGEEIKNRIDMEIKD